MRSVYIRPLNFLYGKDASQHIQKKIAAPICGNKLIAFTKIEIIYKDSKKSQLVDVSKISKLNYKNKDQVLRDLSNIKKKRNNILNLDVNQPVIMGVLNITPDSFSDGGKFYKTKSANQHAKMMLTQGAHIIDVGGESTRPGAQTISEKEECRRVIQTVKQISKIKKCAVSIDTRKSQVMKEAVKAGATIINDVSALDFDPNALLLVSKLKKPIILNHSQGTPETMQKNPNYQNVLIDIYDYFETKIKQLEKKGFPKSKIILDPGIGFGKNVEHNLTLMSKISFFHSLGCPLMLGPSRKSFIGKIMGKSDSISRLGGTISSVIIGANQGVQFFRVHDIIEIKEALSINSALHKI
jgi:dihydropteroate synthase